MAVPQWITSVVCFFDFSADCMYQTFQDVYFEVYRKLLGLVGLRKYFLRKFPALFCRSFDPYCALFLEVHGAHHSQEFLQSKLAIL